jgi:hypothetical protein
LHFHNEPDCALVGVYPGTWQTDNLSLGYIGALNLPSTITSKGSLPVFAQPLR